MIQKILKIQLVILFLVTIINLAIFYFQNQLPDHMFSVSSNSPSLNVISYYFTSFLVIITYYTGPWIFLPFFTYAVLISFQLDKKARFYDPLAVIPILGVFVVGTYFLAPNFLGKAPSYYFNTFFKKWQVAGIGVLFLGLLIPVYLLPIILYPISILKKFIDKTQKTFELLKNSRLVSFIRRHNKFFSNLFLKLKLAPIFSSLNSNLKKIKPNFQWSWANQLSQKIKQFRRSYEEKIKPVEQVEKKVKPQEKEPIKESNKPEKSPPKNEKNLPVKSLSENQFFFPLIRTKKRPKVDVPSQEYYADTIKCLESKLAEFKVQANITNILKGPVVDTFELELGPGVKVSKVTSLTEDLTLALCGLPIRMVYPMRGKSTIGIEIPRSPREIIYLDEILTSKTYKKGQWTLPLALGKNTFGDVVVHDLVEMPHMLVAGTTGSGKSVFLNALLASLLAKKTPDDLNLILIDPKQLELATFSHLPHLALPVIVEANAAKVALKWACHEMDRRYQVLRREKLRDLRQYHSRFLKTDHKDHHLPHLVVVIDEFADLILGPEGKEIELLICRLAAKSRASGIHIIMATQRPSVDVITGLIKANFPSRVSFKVSSSVDSRTILNALGSERLLGKGDMLFKQGVEMLRLHAPLIIENELENLLKTIESERPNFNPMAIEFINQLSRKQQLENTGPYTIDSSAAMAQEAFEIKDKISTNPWSPGWSSDDENQVFDDQN